MNVLVVGGTGFVGQHILRELVEQGHDVTVLARSRVGCLPDSVTMRCGDIQSMDDRTIDRLVAGHHGIVYAATAAIVAPRGTDADSYFRQANVDPVARLVAAARRADCDRVVVLGSFFVTLHRERPELRLPARNPYVQSRLDQARAARQAADGQISVAVLEIPYVVGATPGRESALAPQVRSVMRGRMGPLVYPGGIAVVSVSALARAAVAALDRRAEGNFPVATANLTWPALMRRLAAASDRPPTHVWSLGRVSTALLFRVASLGQRLQGLQAGLDLVQMGHLFSENLFLDLDVARAELGVDGDDVEQALRDTVRGTPAS